MIYFDQAASSFPKPKEVTEAMIASMNEIGANPGRGAHSLARAAANVVNEAREKAAELFGSSNPNQCLFFQNATIALNQAIKGMYWEKGDHIITTSSEHNSVRRPLEYVKKQYGVEVTYVEWKDNDTSFIYDFKKSITHSTKLITVSHASNVTGSLLPLDKIMDIAEDHNILALVDASQTAGHLPIHMIDQRIDMLAFPGHKGLLGPQGIGMLIVEGNIELDPIHQGGTGIFSEYVNQPNQWPERFESGTLNTPGIAGLLAAFKKYEERLTQNVPRETNLAKKLLARLKTIPGITCFIPSNGLLHIPIVAFNVNKVDSQEIAVVLDSHYNIAVRAGLHCNPLAHGTLETLEQGVVRVSLGIYNTEEEIDVFVDAIKEIVTAYKEM